MVEQTWRRYSRRAPLVQRDRHGAPLRADARAGPPAAEPRGPRRREPVRGVQHGHQLRDQHELAGLRRRDDHELPDADAGAHVPELHVGRGRDGGARRADPRVHASARRRPRQLLARHCSRAWCTSCSRSRDRRRRPRHAGRRADVLALGGGARIQGFDQTIARGPVASQIAIKQLGHERRRVLQRELRASVRGRGARSATSSSCSRSCSSPRRSATCSARWSGTSARAGPSSRR